MVFHFTNIYGEHGFYFYENELFWTWAQGSFEITHRKMFKIMPIYNDDNNNNVLTAAVLCAFVKLNIYFMNCLF